MSTPLDPWARRWQPTQLPDAERSLLPVLRPALLSWQRRFGRHDLPWHTRDPYGVWISEVMLQQTQVATGLYRYPAWMQTFPDVASLAAATPQQVLKAWEGLGYYARARNLHAAAKRIVDHHAGQFPESRSDRLSLPGIGPSTASAIGAFAFGRREAIFDANVARVWARWWGNRPLPTSPAERQRFWWGWAQEATPTSPAAIRTWTQAVMDLGALVCVPRAPLCPSCPLRASCRGRALGEPQRWPEKRPKLERKTWSIPWQWRLRKGKVAVVQRPAGAPWEGLWALPEGESSHPALATGRHDLSHRRVEWSISPAPSAFPEPSWSWVDRAAFDALPLPRPLRRWWADLGQVGQAAVFGAPPHAG